MPQGALYTYADLESFPDDNIRREIIDGELIVPPSPVTRHQRLHARLFGALWNAVQESQAGEVFSAPFDVVFSDINVVQPDLLFIASDQGVLTEKNVQGAPALVIEVMSNPRMDRIRKRDLYARFGVPEYWIVDPEADRIEIHRLRDGSYGKPEILEPGDVLTYPRIPDLAIDLTKLFA